MKPVQNQSSEVTQAEISSLYSGDQTRTFTVYPAVETVSGDEPVVTPQPFLPTSSFFPQNEQPVSEEEGPDIEVLERKSEAEPGYLLQGRSLGSDYVFPLKHHQDLNLQRKQQALNIQKQQQHQQALEIMQQQQALQQQYMILQQQQALSLQQQNLPTIQQPYSSLQQQQPALQQPYSNLQQPYSNLQQPYSDISGQTLYQALPSPNPQQLGSLQQSYNLPPVVQPPYPAGPISFIPADEPQTSASALGGQFQPYQPTYQDQYDDIGNEQVLPLPYGELAPRADQPEEGIYPQESYAQPQEANERGYGIGGYHHGGYGGHHPVVAPVVGHGLHRVHTHQRIPFPVPVPHPVPVPVVRAIHHQHHTAGGGDGQHAHEHGHNHNHDHQHGHQHSHENSHNHVHKHTHHHDHHHNHKHHNEHVHEEKHKHGHEHAHAHAPG